MSAAFGFATTGPRHRPLAVWAQALVRGVARGLSGPALTEAVQAHRPEPMVVLPATPQKGASA
jgi:hypothetical protein